MVATAATVLAAALTTGLVDLLTDGPAPATSVSAAGAGDGTGGRAGTPAPDTTGGASESPGTTAATPAPPSPAPSGPGPSGPAPAGAGATPTPDPARPAERGLDLSVPALGLQTEVLEVSPADGAVDPPTFDRAYVIAPYGRPGSDNTTYIAGHSWNRGDAVFNPLLDVPSQQAVLTPGDTVVVTQDGTTYTYEVTGSRRYPKGSLAEADEVWAKVPDRLVLITCFQRNDGAASRDNLVVTAELVHRA